MKEISAELNWRQQPRQVAFVRACGLGWVFEGKPEPDPVAPVARILLYGGAAGGGKSDTLLMTALIAAFSFPGCNIGFFRREYPHLDGPGGAIMRSHQLFSGVAKWNGTNRRWTFPNRSVVQFCHCKNEEDVYNYQSQQFDILLVDESTQMTEFQLRYLQTRNRATVKGIVPFAAYGTNPGGVSHGFHKKYFVKVGRPGTPVDVEIREGFKQRHLFIPSRLADNQVLEERDPGYRKTLESQSEDVRRALLYGDWDVFSGQYFRDFRVEKHVVEPFEIPSWWRRFGSIDWGYNAPCAVLFHAIDPTASRVYTYKEFYLTEHRAADVAAIVKGALDSGEELQYIKASPDMWHERGLGSKALPGEIIAEEFTKLNLNVEPADNRRIIGWQRMREFLSTAPDGKPWWQMFSTCEHLVRTLPELIYDDKKVEDVSDKCEDHAPESARYFLMSRPSPVDGESFMPGAREHYDESEDDDEDFGLEDDGNNFYGV